MMAEEISKEGPAEMPQFRMPVFPPALAGEPSPNWPLGPWCQYVLLNYMHELLLQRETVWRNEELEGVHQIRVAARRLRTALQTFGSLWDPSMVRRHSRYLAKFADAFGEARDLDVMIVYLEAQLHGAHRERRAALEWMLAGKRAMRIEQQPRLEETLLKLESDNYAQEFVDLFGSLPMSMDQLEAVHES